MRRMLLIESFEYVNTTPHGRWTCLKCGHTSHVTVRSGYETRWPHDEFIMNPTHECAPRGVGANHEHWREVVRDCFLEGRDAEAIAIICLSMNLVSP